VLAVVPLRGLGLASPWFICGALAPPGLDIPPPAPAALLGLGLPVVVPVLVFEPARGAAAPDPALASATRMGVVWSGCTSAWRSAGTADAVGTFVPAATAASVTTMAVLLNRSNLMSFLVGLAVPGWGPLPDHRAPKLNA